MQGNAQSTVRSGLGADWDDLTERLEGGRGEWLKGKDFGENRKQCTLMKV